jgi:large subunit ribosomal protein L1
MPKSKRYEEVKAKVDSGRMYSVDEAMNLIIETKSAKFDETVEVAVKLGIDPRQADQQIRSAIVLPHGIGKEVRVLVFARGEKAQEAKESGADYVGAEEYVEKISKQGWLDFDIAIATPDMMGIVGGLGRILGPRGLMPSPKVGTVTFEVAKAVREAKAGRIQIRNDKGGVVHAPIGKVSFGAQKLKDNFLAFMETLSKMKPPTSRGTFIRRVVVSNTMGPGIKVDPASIRDSLRGFEIAA